jgi:lipoate-protein ligase A
LNYAVILPIDAHPSLETISGANRFVMERHRDLIAQLTGQPVAIEGHTDLAIRSRKFSGNAQRRKRRALLFHGTFLLDFDIGLIEQLLRAPPHPPAYREQRRHAEFLTRLPLVAVALKSALEQAWHARPPSVDVPQAAIARLVAERYSTDDWNLKR